MFEGLGRPVSAEPDVEADDVIGTYAQRAADRGQHYWSVTGDKDMAPLVGDCVKLLDTMKNRTMDHDGVIARFGVPPDRIVAYLALMGDSVENIPGVPTVVPKHRARGLHKNDLTEGIVGLWGATMRKDESTLGATRENR